MRGSTEARRLGYNRPEMQIGIIIVDHGSRQRESNEQLERLARLFVERFGGKYPIVEPAHMDLAEPSVATAYARCAQRGAREIVVCPYFLSPGKHSTRDLPELAGKAAQKFPGTSWRVAPTLGIDELMLDLMEKRVREATDAGK